MKEELRQSSLEWFESQSRENMVWDGFPIFEDPTDNRFWFIRIPKSALEGVYCCGKIKKTD